VRGGKYATVWRFLFASVYAGFGGFPRFWGVDRFLRWVTANAEAGKDGMCWDKRRVFISELFRFEELAFELITPRVLRGLLPRHGDRGNSMRKSFALGLHGEWSESADPVIA
jgi:hypothetical protein